MKKTFIFLLLLIVSPAFGQGVYVGPDGESSPQKINMGPAEKTQGHALDAHIRLEKPFGLQDDSFLNDGMVNKKRGQQENQSKQADQRDKQAGSNLFSGNG